MRPPLTRADIAAITPMLASLADPSTADELLALLRILYAIGRRDLPLARLVEGHVDALQIVHRYGTAAQARAAAAAARDGGAFGVWNADQPGDGTRLDDAGRLSGAKSFASGAGLLSHALISVDGDGGRQLLLVDLATAPPAIDRTWWKVTGMQRSETHIAIWATMAIPDDAAIGAPGDYVREPFFSGGALRFAAVQAGGIAAVADGVRDHLNHTKRAADPHQAARLADLYGHAQAAADAVRGAALGWAGDDPTGTIARVSAARVAVYRAGEAVLAIAPAAIGVQAMFVDHPIAPTLTDLATYLRQPNPDGQRMAVGAAVATGLLAPTL